MLVQLVRRWTLSVSLFCAFRLHLVLKKFHILGGKKKRIWKMEIKKGWSTFAIKNNLKKSDYTFFLSTRDWQIFSQQMQPYFLSIVGSDFPFYPSTYSRILALLTHLLLICILFNLGLIQDFSKASVNNFSTTIIITQNSFSWKPWLLQMPETWKFRLVCLYSLSSSLILIYFFLPALFFTRC